MERVFAIELPQRIGKKIVLRGWLNNTRSFGKLTFLILRDKTGFAQIVIQEKKETEKLNGLQPGTILTIRGECASSQEAHLHAEIKTGVWRREERFNGCYS